MKFIFVGGCERSGTSLVQKLLLAHENIAGGPEFIFTNRIAALYGQMATEYPRHYTQRLASHFDNADLAQRFRHFYSGFFDDALTNKPHATLVSEKTPSNIFAARYLLRLFPDSRFVHVVRDGRDVLASHRKVLQRLRKQGETDYNRNTFKPHHICARWRHAIDMHFKVLADADLSPRYHCLRYEDLVGDSAASVRELYSFIGLSPPEVAFTPEQISASELGLPVDGAWTTKDNDARPFDASACGRWRRELPMTTRLVARLLLSEQLAKVDYPASRAWQSLSRAFWRLRSR